MKNVTFGHVG